MWLYMTTGEVYFRVEVCDMLAYKSAVGTLNHGNFPLAQMAKAFNLYLYCPFN